MTAVGLTVTGNWFRDRLFEAGADNTLAAMNLDADVVGKWCEPSSMLITLFTVCAYSSALWALLVSGVCTTLIKTSRPLALDPVNRDVQKVLDQYTRMSSRSRLVAKVMKDAVARQKLKQVLQDVLRIVQRVRVPLVGFSV